MIHENESSSRRTVCYILLDVCEGLSLDGCLRIKFHRICLDVVHKSPDTEMNGVVEESTRAKSRVIDMDVPT